MNTAQQAHYLWQHAQWPRCHYDLPALSLPLTRARQQLEQLALQLRAIGLVQGDTSAMMQDIWVQEALATAAIEGQQLDTEQVRSSVMRKLGLASTGTSARHIDGLVAVMFDATQNLDKPLHAEQLCHWQASLFPHGISGMQRIQVGQFRSFDDAMQIVSGESAKKSSIIAPQILHKLAR